MVATMPKVTSNPAIIVALSRLNGSRTASADLLTMEASDAFTPVATDIGRAIARQGDDWDAGWVAPLGVEPSGSALAGGASAAFGAAGGPALDPPGSALIGASVVLEGSG